MTLRGPDGRVFTSSYAHFLDEHPSGDAPKIYVPFKASSSSATIYGLLDTGAAWSMFTFELSERMGLLDLPGQAVPISTRLGTIHGKLVRTSLYLCAEMGGDIVVDSTVFVSEDWRGDRAPIIIGYGGLLERIRFAVDPSRDALRWHFAPASP